MIGMGVGIDNEVQLETMVGEHREIPFDVGVERVYQNRVSPALVGYQIGLAAFAVELAQDHGRLIGGCSWPVRFLEVAPEPPFLEHYLAPVDHPGGTPGA